MVPLAPLLPLLPRLTPDSIMVFLRPLLSRPFYHPLILNKHGTTRTLIAQAADQSLLQSLTPLIVTLEQLRILIMACPRAVLDLILRT